MSVPRSATSGLRLGSLDDLRGAAILMVCGYHALGTGFGRDQLPWGRWTRVFADDIGFNALSPLTFGWFGVPIFFAVSGFCIHLGHVSSGSGGFFPFFVRRAFRIYPPYLLALLLFVFAVSANRKGLATVEGLGQLFSHLALVQNLHDRWFYGVNFSFWSIAIEAQLYVLYPVLVWLTKRTGWVAGLSLLAAVEVGVRLGVGVHSCTGQPELPRAITDNPLVYWFSWGMGAYCAELSLAGRLGTLSRSSITLWAAMAVLFQFFKPLQFLSFTAVAVATTIWISRQAPDHPRPSGSSFASSGLRQIGVWSYSIYLLHQPIILSAGLLASTLVPVTWDEKRVRLGGALVMVALLMPICAMSHAWVELPFSNLGKRLARIWDNR